MKSILENFGLNSYSWRYVLNGWCLLLFGVIIWDFITSNGIPNIVEPVSVIYTAILAIYSTEKEFERWHDQLSGRHMGEVYVIVWTILLLGLFIVGMVFRYTYIMPTEVIATYIAVISILAITKKSKGFYLKKKKVTYLK
ncbi:hypothetical protein IPJ70_01545 [Candidatus Campbellbacteria bacterium]|nr:MAG: hypothetical protein IPJ70_01545 [Candidatus Campbellbacteria bacterium]